MKISAAWLELGRLFWEFELELANLQQETAADVTRQDEPSAAASAQQTTGHGESTPPAKPKQTQGPRR